MAGQFQIQIEKTLPASPVPYVGASAPPSIAAKLENNREFALHALCLSTHVCLWLVFHGRPCTTKAADVWIW